MLPKSKGFRFFAFLIVIVLFLIAIPNQSAQALDIIYRVTPTGATSGTCGDSWANPCALQYAISLAGTGDQVWATAGTYYPTAGIDRTISFNLKSGLAIYGGFAGTETELTQRDPATNVTILSGDIGTIGDTTDNSYHVVYGYNINNSAILDGVTISSGNGNGASPYDRGGGIYNYLSSPTLTLIIFTNNSTSNIGGAMANVSSSPILTDVSFINNTGTYGGAIYNNNSSPFMTNTVFTSNVASERGGGMYNNSGNPIVNGATFTTNSAADRGGAICNTYSNLTLSNVSFIQNTATTSGGGIYTGGGTVTISDSSFTENSSFGGGGMLNTAGATIDLTNVIFTSNIGTERAGGMYNYQSSPTLNYVTFTNNQAGIYGGGMFNGSSNTILNHVTFSGNTSSTWGGGMDNNASSPVLTDVTFSNNSATVSGGAVHNWEYSSPSFTNVLFENNTAGERGGGMYNVDYCDFTLTDVTFNGNTADEFGGGMFTSGSNPTLTRVTFNGNSTPNYGGGIYNSFTFMTLTDVTFTNNLAGVTGAGMANNNSDSILTNITFSGNTAQVRGGGFYNYQGDPVLTNVTFSENTAVSEYGGGIFTSSGSLTLNSSTFADNDAGGNGGALAVSGSTTVVNNSILWGNTAGSSGPQVYSFTAGQPTINDSVMEGGCPSGATCTNIFTTDPSLGILGNNGGFTQTIPISMTSSALDTANATTSPATDQRGIARPKGYADDIGAFELEWDPTVVELISFTAERDGTSISLFWETATEFDNLGFNLYRASTAEGVRTQLNATPIPTNTYPGSLMGAAYSFTDTAVLDPRLTYFYWLEDVNVRGFKTLHGPIEVTGDPGIFELTSFIATPVEKNVVLTWITTNEPDVSGYKLYRAVEVDGKQTLLTAELIQSLGFNGGTYTFMDTGRDLRQGLKPAYTYYYWLEVLHSTDQSTSVGPVEVKPLPKVPPRKHKLPHQPK